MEENIKNENIKEIVVNLPKVENMTSIRGNNIPNQFIIYGKDYTLFQSYNSPIAMKKEGKVYLFKDWDYSVTTGKYRNDFLGENKATTLKKIKSKEYILVDLVV